MKAATALDKSPRRFRPFRRLRQAIRKLHLGTRGRRSKRSGDRGYLVCSSPRAGSTYLCQLLASTGLLGVPRKYLNVMGRWGQLDQSRPTDLRLLFNRARSAGATANGVYGLKAHADHFAAIAAVVDPLLILPDLEFVHIRRQDILGQAISWVRANQTQQFLETDSKRTEPVYDAAMIRAFLHMLVEQNTAWERFFAAAGRMPLTITYEHLMQNPQQQVDLIAKLVGVDLPVPIVLARVTIRIQRDALNAAWRRQFLHEGGDSCLDVEADDLARTPSRRSL